MFRKWTLLIVCGLHVFTLKAQIKPIPSNEIQQNLQKLNTLGTVLYFAAHPDDENTKLIAWLAQERKYRTAYLSLTRGDGGQNLIGTEQGIELGLTRTQELLAARSIDKGEQLFSSAYDFGFSKTHEETFSFWDKNTALREAVFLIRKLQPDVIINRFPPDKRGGHGHHQASAILSHEAFIAAADPKMFPEQLQEVKPWKAKRLLWNTYNFAGQNTTSENQLKIEIGDYNPLLASSYGEIAAKSRSQHKSQGFGAASSRGRSLEYFDLVTGEPASIDLMDGIETTWKRIPNTEKIQQLILEINNEFQPLHPQKSIKKLFQLKNLIQQINNDHWKQQKIKEINDLIISCAGLWIEATTTKGFYAVNTKFDINIETIVRNPDTKVEIVQLNQQDVNKSLSYNTVWNDKISSTWNQITQPYWLLKEHSLGKFEVSQNELGNPTNPIKPSVKLSLLINGESIVVETPIKHKYVDPVQGELFQDITIAPAITASLSSDNIISVNNESKKIKVTFTRNDKNIKTAVVDVTKAAGWNITPSALTINFENSDQVSKEITIHPISTASANTTLSFTWNNERLMGVKTIQYDHIPQVTWFPPTIAKIQNLSLVNPVKKVAYLTGAGDLVAQSLNQIGIETTSLNDKKISLQELQNFDAVIVGVRYFNITEPNDETIKVLLEYVQNGGTLVVQYNVNTGLKNKNIGPYPIQLSRTRVTEEDAEVTLDKKDPILLYPNEITEKDFNDWIQERGLYFAENIDSRYRTPLSMNDKNEVPSNGALLVAKYGKGKFVYTSLAFFRQLPAGVPGAYRLFVNLLSKEN